MLKRKPDFIIGDNYLRRWWVIPRNRWFNIYLHHICRSDQGEHLHDHPWWNVSIILKGWYLEKVIEENEVCEYFTRKIRKRGSVVFRKATDLHRLEVPEGETVWTLFITGPVVRTWGFDCPNGWRPWFKYVDPDNPGQIGAGCGEDV